MNLTKIFLDRPLLTNLVTIFIIAMGLLSVSQINKSTYPDVSFEIMSITTIYPGASANEVEINVTKKIEDELSGVQGIDRVISISAENLSTIIVYIDLNEDFPEKIKDKINRAVDRISDLPAEIEGIPIVSELNASNAPVIEIALLNKRLSEMEIRQFAKDLKSELKEINGVTGVQLIGYRQREVQIKGNLKELKQKYLSLHDVLSAIKGQNLNLPAGPIIINGQKKKVVTQAELPAPENIKDLIVRSNNTGEKVIISEIAEIKDGLKEAKVISRTNSVESINLIVRSNANGDVIDISDQIEALIEKSRGNYTQEVEIKVVRNFGRYIVSLLDIVSNNAYFGFGLVFISLMIFLNRYAAFWTASGIPLSILGSFIFFPLLGININFIPLITLILVLGLIVDDAIVVSENIIRHREMGKSIYQAALDGTKEVTLPVVTTIITTILAFLPILFMSGITGRFIQEIPKIVILTLIFSLFESLVILPSHIAHGPKIEQKTLGWFERLKDRYGELVHWVFGHRLKALGLFAGFLISCVLLFQTKMKFILFPYSDVDIFYVLAELPEGTTLNETSKKMRDIEKVVSQMNEQEMTSYTTRVGHHHTDVYRSEGSSLKENWAIITVYLKLAEDRIRSSESIMDELNENLKLVSKGFDRLELMKFYDGPPVGRPITITLASDNDFIRKKYSSKIYDFLKSIPGVQNLETDKRPGKEEIKVIPNFDKMNRLGVSAESLSQTLRMAFEGIVASSITRNGEEIDFLVTSNKEEYKGEKVFDDLQVINNFGKLIDVNKFVEYQKYTSDDRIIHYNYRRSETILGDVDEKIITSSEVNELVRQQFQQAVDNEPGLTLIYGGEEKATSESFKSLGIAFFLAVIAIYFTLSILFNSIFQPLIILSTVPFGLCGVIISFYTHGLPLSFFAMIGSMGLMGILVNDALIMVSHLNALIKQKGLSIDTLVTASKDRFRAVMLTTISTTMGMIPTIYGFGGKQPFLTPLVLSVAGGLILGTIITLVLVPLLYSFKLKK